MYDVLHLICTDLPPEPADESWHWHQTWFLGNIVIRLGSRAKCKVCRNEPG